MQLFKTFWKSNKLFILFILLMSVFRSAVADWYTVPTGSMQPTIQVGDRIIVNKMAYDLRLPFTQYSLFNTGEPERGDIAVFESNAANNRLVKRIIGLPGDAVSMNDEKLYINGKAVEYTHMKNEAGLIHAVEDLGQIKHNIHVDEKSSNRLSNFNSVVVPPNSYLVLGDNRRNSADSRVYGFVPRHELKGKAVSIAFSLNYDNYYLPRSDRSFIDIYKI
jgi:signal peptidase I